jgi:hypothetical protein
MGFYVFLTKFDEKVKPNLVNQRVHTYAPSLTVARGISVLRRPANTEISKPCPRERPLLLCTPHSATASDSTHPHAAADEDARLAQPCGGMTPAAALGSTSFLIPCVGPSPSAPPPRSPPPYPSAAGVGAASVYGSAPALGNRGGWACSGSSPGAPPRRAACCRRRPTSRNRAGAAERAEGRRTRRFGGGRGS